jgi:5-oxoprolinase (ATP-hydrolysing) subunit A
VRLRSIDLNADLGEAAEAEAIEVERALLEFVTTAHVACGGHAGDDDTMAATVEAALAAGVRVGAHPSYPDPEGFGRRPMELDRRELEASVRAQLAALDRVCRAAGTTIASVKAHGSLYEAVGKGGTTYLAFRDAVRASCGDVPLVLPSACRAMAMVMRDGVQALEEGFCDRTYRADGGLVDRADEGALLTDPEAAASHAVSLARGAVVARDGSVLTLWIDTLCVHGDFPGAVQVARAVREALTDAGIDVAPPTRA